MSVWVECKTVTLLREAKVSAHAFAQTVVVQTFGYQRTTPENLTHPSHTTSKCANKPIPVFETRYRFYQCKLSPTELSQTTERERGGERERESDRDTKRQLKQREREHPGKGKSGPDHLKFDTPPLGLEGSN